MSILPHLTQLFKPPVFADPDENRLARNLYYFAEIAGAFLLLAMPLLIFAAATPKEKWVVVCLDGGWVVSTPLYLWLIRRGYVRPVGYFYISLTWIFSLVFIFNFYDNVLASAFVLLGITALAGQILGSREVLLFGSLGLIAQLVKLFAGSQGWMMNEILPAQLKGEGLISILFYVLLSAMLWGITRSLSSALQKSRHNEHLLQEQNQVLHKEITERAQTEAALEASENNYRQLLEEAADGIFIFDSEGHVISVNSRGSEILGVSRDRLLKMSVLDFFSSSEIDDLLARGVEMRQGKTFIIERTIPREDGTQISIETSSKYLNQGQYLAIIRDITKRKETENYLNQQHARMKALHDIALSLFIVQEEEELMQIILNQAMQMLGVTLSAFALSDSNGQIAARKVMTTLPNLDAEVLQALKNHSSHLARQAFQTLEPAVMNNDGEIAGCSIQENISLHAAACIPMLVSGKCVGVLAYGHTRPQVRFTPEDIQMGVLLAQLAAVALNNIQLLRQSRVLAQNETSLNTITNTILKTTDIQEMFTSLCQQLAELFGANSAYLTRWNEAHQKPTPVAAFGDAQNAYSSMAVLSNEQTMTASVLKAGRTLVAEDVFNSPYISPRISAQFSTQSMIGLPLIGGDQKLGAVIISFHQARTFHADEIALAERAAQQIALALARIHFFEALRQSEANLREAQQMAHMGNFDYDVQAHSLYWSEELYRIFGLDSATPITPEMYEQLLTPQEYQRMIEAAEPIVRSGKAHQFEHEITLPSGEHKHILAITRPVMDARNNIQRIFGIVQDLTELRQVEKALTAREERLRQAVRVGNIGIFEHNHRTGEIYWSPEERNIYGWGATEELTVENYIEQIHPEDRPGILLALRDASNPLGDGRFDVEHRIIRRDGAIRWVSIRSQAMFGEENGVRFLERTIGAVIDITEQKSAINTLRESETQLAIIFDNVSEYQVLYRVDGLDRVVTQTMNQAFVEMFQFQFPEFSAEMIQGKTIQEGFEILSYPSETVKANLARIHSAVTRLESVFFEEEILFGHEPAILSISLVPILDDAGLCTHLLWSGRDITEQKRAEAQLRTSLQEKEILLKEIHHRVKNNLQVISSLLYLQSQKIKDERFFDLFRESQNRVGAMALVHEQLYQSDNFAEVNFGTYIRTLASSLFDSYGVDPYQVTLAINTDGSTLDVHTAIPCGLLLSEILSNALKYAFPEGRRGQITIKFYEENQLSHIWVTDDGVGMPDSAQMRPGSLGLQLIDRLVAQIGGTLERSGPPGTSYHIWRGAFASV